MDRDGPNNWTSDPLETQNSFTYTSIPPSSSYPQSSSDEKLPSDTQALSSDQSSQIPHPSGTLNPDEHNSSFLSDLESSEFTTQSVSVTPTQQQVIEYPCNSNEILRVRAGPGSGKTFTMVARVASLLQRGIAPDEIVVLSMANRSVDALRDALARLIGPTVAEKVHISTFHSFCGGLLDQYGHMLGPDTKKYKIFDPQSWTAMIRFFSGKSVKFNNIGISGSISPSKLDSLLTSVLSGKLSVADAAHIYSVNAVYIQNLLEYLKQNGMLRYDELINDALKLITQSLTNPLANLPQLSNYKAVFVDEFQDIYPMLINVVKAIVSYPNPQQKKHLTVTGDPNQCIYEFLGVSQKDMDFMHHIFPNMNIVDLPLHESFRCTQPILDAAGVCLRDNSFALTSCRQGFASKPILFRCQSAQQEQNLVADEIHRILVSDSSIKPGDIAVLSRTNDRATAIQSVLKSRYSIPSHKISQGNVWVKSKMHVYKHVLSVIAGDSDSSFNLLALLHILDTKPGNRLRISKIFNNSLREGIFSDSMFLESYLFSELEATEKQGSKSFLARLYVKDPHIVEHMAKFLNQVQTERVNLEKWLQDGPLAYGPLQLVLCLQRMSKLDGIREYVESDQKPTTTSNTDILESFNSSLHHSFGKYASNPDLQVQPFLNYFLHTYDSEVPALDRDSVQVSTIHAAKGLEFPIVFVLGQTRFGTSWDNLLMRTGTETEGSSSSSRLLYVAVTRARDVVYIGSKTPLSKFPAELQANFTEQVPDFASPQESSWEEKRLDFSERSAYSPFQGATRNYSTTSWVPPRTFRISPRPVSLTRPSLLASRLMQLCKRI